MWDRGLTSHLLIGWGMCTGWGESRANASSRWGRRGDSLYCSINSYTMGEGRMIRVWFFCSCIPRPSLVLSALSSLGHHTHQLNASHGGFLHFKERTFFNSADTFTNNSHMRRLFLIWWHLTILRWAGMTYCTLTMDMMWLLTLIRF